MSWFNPKAFAAGALGELASGMTRREEEARKYEEEQRELAKESRSEIGRRRSIVGALVSEARRLESLGVSKAQIQAAHSSGPGGLMELSKMVQAEVKRRGGKARLSEYDISAMIDSSDMNPMYAEMDYEEFMSRSAGLLDTQAGDLKEPKVNILQRALGVGAKDRVRAKLDKEETVGGMSIYDINELARGQAYQSMMPGAYATFTPGEFYDQEAALKSWSIAQKRIDTSLKTDDEYLRLQQLGDKGASALEYKRKKYAAYAQSQFNKYGADAINDPVVNWKDLLGEDLYTELAVANEADEQIISAIDAGAADFMGKTITREGNNGSYKLHTGLGDTVAKITLTGPKGEQVVQDPKLISEFLDSLVAKGEMSEENASKLRPEARGASITEVDTVGLGMAGELDITALTEAALGAAEEEVAEPELESGPVVTEAPEVETIAAPSADEFKLKGVTYEEWLGMSRKEREEKGLPTSVVGGEVGFKRFQKGLGVNIAKDQPATEFADMGQGQANIESIDAGTVVTVGGEDYRVGESLGQKYFEKLDDASLSDEALKDLTEKAINEFAKKFEEREYSAGTKRDLKAAFSQFLFENDLPEEVEQFIEARLDKLAEALAGN